MNLSTRPCYLCDREATARCYKCGQLMCAEHGEVNCVRCDESIMAGDPRAGQIREKPTSPVARPGWWQPQEAEDFAPPMCGACGRLTRAKCRTCRTPYCNRHAGRKGRCADCSGGSRLDDSSPSDPLTSWIWFGVVVLLFSVVIVLSLWHRMIGF